MRQTSLVLPMVLALAGWFGHAEASGTLEGPIRISSRILHYDLQYWIYLPENYEKPLDELYITDGQAYLAAGSMKEVLDQEIDSGRIRPIAAIFVDSRDPDYPEESRRGREFMCNVEYAKFYVGELMPEISQRWTGAGPDTRRAIMGASFGAINAACFAMMLPGVFQVVIMQSPGSDEHLDVINGLYQERPRNPSALFISHGGPQDNRAAALRFVQTLQDQGYPLRHVATDGGHDWDNWTPLLDDSLRAFAGTAEEDGIGQAAQSQSGLPQEQQPEPQ